MSEQNAGFAKEYSDDSFWGKVKNFAKTAGADVVEKALQLYYAMQQPATPIWAKTVIVGALGYFISPIDAISDFIPVVGYVDDLGALTLAVGAVAMYITDDVKAMAKAKLQDWFGE